jgi:hypothetical protein
MSRAQSMRGGERQTVGRENDPWIANWPTPALGRRSASAQPSKFMKVTVMSMDAPL